MNKGFIFTLGLAVGGTIGCVASWMLLKTKYERLAQEEIEEVRGYYNSITNTSEETEVENIGDLEEIEEVDEKTASNIDYTSIASMYSTPKDEKKEEGGNEVMSRTEPYVISPAEFGTIDNYDTVTLVYYNDGILADSDNNIVEDIESCIGYESLNHFGEYVNDTVYVRNEDATTDYEVVLDETDYADLEDIG